MKNTLIILIILFLALCSCSGDKSCPDITTSNISADTVSIITEKNDTIAMVFDYEIDQKCSDCCAINFTTYGMKKCAFQAIEEWEAEMNKYYSLLLDILETKTKDKLIKAQGSWQEFSLMELQLNRELYGKMDGADWVQIGIGQTMDKVKNRALELKAYYIAITEEN